MIRVSELPDIMAGKACMRGTGFSVRIESGKLS